MNRDESGLLTVSSLPCLSEREHTGVVNGDVTAIVVTIMDSALARSDVVLIPRSSEVVILLVLASSSCVVVISRPLAIVTLLF